MFKYASWKRLFNLPHQLQTSNLQSSLTLKKRKSKSPINSKETVNIDRPQTMTLSNNSHVASSSSAVSPPSSPSSDSIVRKRKERSDPIKAGDAWLQSTNKRRRYMRRGSKVSTMLMTSTFEIQSLVLATTMIMPSPPRPPHRSASSRTDGSVGASFVQQNHELSSAVGQRQRLLKLVAEINDSMSLLSTNDDRWSHQHGGWATCPPRQKHYYSVLHEPNCHLLLRPRTTSEDHRNVQAPSQSRRMLATSVVHS